MCMMKIAVVNEWTIDRFLDVTELERLQLWSVDESSVEAEWFYENGDLVF